MPETEIKTKNENLYLDNIFLLPSNIGQLHNNIIPVHVSDMISRLVVSNEMTEYLEIADIICYI